MRVAIILLICVTFVAVSSEESPPPSNCFNYCKRYRLVKQEYCCEPSNNIETHEGTCPEAGSGCGTKIANSVPVRDCKQDGECAETDKCCYDGCLERNVCKTANKKSEPIVHPGKCPKLDSVCRRRFKKTDIIPCKTDNDCAKTDKCCGDACIDGTVCKTAVVPWRFSRPE